MLNFSRKVLLSIIICLRVTTLLHHGPAPPSAASYWLPFAASLPPVAADWLRLWLWEALSQQRCQLRGPVSQSRCIFSQSAFGRWAVTRVSSVSASGVSSQFVSALEARDRGWGWSLWGQRRDFGVSIPRSDKSKRFLLWDYKKGGERLGNDFWLFPNVQLFHYFRMTDNGVEMVGGESNNQGQVRDKVLFGAIKPLL